MKILIIFGTRPEAIKMAPLVLRLRLDFEVKVCVTGQHREMLDQVLELFKIIPDYDLKLMKPNQNLSNLTGEVLNGVTYILLQNKFDWVLVQGDTTSKWLEQWLLSIRKSLLVMWRQGCVHIILDHLFRKS